jgi:hypothetical protein
MGTHFQLPPYEFHWATRQARDLLSVPTLYGPDFSLRNSCAASWNVFQKLSRTEQSTEEVFAYLWVLL